MVRRPMSTTIWLCVGRSETVSTGIQPYVPFGRIGMLTRYQTLPSEPTALRTASISCGRKSGRNWCITLITRARGSGALRTATESTTSPPAAGKADTPEGGFCVVVVTWVVVVAWLVVVAPVVVVPVAPARARVGSNTAAENPAVARTAEAIAAGGSR